MTFTDNTKNPKKCRKSRNDLNGLKATKRISENMFSKKKTVLGGQCVGLKTTKKDRECEQGIWMKGLLFEEEAFSGIWKNMLDYLLLFI